MTDYPELSALRERLAALARQEQLLMRIGAFCAIAGPRLEGACRQEMSMLTIHPSPTGLESSYLLRRSVEEYSVGAISVAR
jgi:hypothetical protein